MPPAITNCQASESPPQTRASRFRYLPNIGIVHPPVRESIGEGRQLRHRPWSVLMGKVSNGRFAGSDSRAGGCSPSEWQPPASLLLTGKTRAGCHLNAGHLLRSRHNHQSSPRSIAKEMCPAGYSAIPWPPWPAPVLLLYAIDTII